MKKIAQSIFLSLALFACGVTPLATGFSFGEKDNNVTGAEVNSVKNDGSYVSVGELWNNNTRTFNLDNMRIMLSYMGISDMTLSNLKNVSETPKTSADFYATTLSAGKEGKVTFAEKKENQNINVTLGGLEWTVTYLSQDKSGNPVVTLWLSNSTQDAFKDRALDEGQYYGYANGGLYSDWAYDWYSYETNDPYPSAMYGTSYIRAVTLNNGGQYAINTTTLSDSVSQDSNSVFALFTMSANGDGKDLVDYITTPSEMAWQEAGQSTKISVGFSYNSQNENWALESDDNFSPPNSYDENGDYNYSKKTKYDTWKNDKLWLPSMSETGYSGASAGIWKTNILQRMNYDGRTTNTSLTVGKNKNDPATTFSWLRSGHYDAAHDVYNLFPSGNEYYNPASVSSIYAVRPALHLNLGNINIERKTIFKSYDDLMVDNNISTDAIKILELQQQEVTDAEIDEYTNDGYDLINCFGTTYHILTERGFLYITNNSISKIPLSNKNLILHTDVYINDEKFDKNGNVLCDSYGRPLYGDNVVYAWQKPSMTNAVFDGRGHTIYGLYDNPTNDNSWFSLFGRAKLKSIKNLNVYDVYLYGLRDSCIATEVEIIENCKTSGYIVARKNNGEQNSGVVQSASTIINCINYCDLIDGSQNAGIAVYGTYLKNCENYGNIYGGYTCSGIVFGGGNTLENCKNFGYLKGMHLGAMTGLLDKESTKITRYINCENYGTLCTQSGGVSGLVGSFYYSNSSLLMIGCKQFGEIDNESVGGRRELVGNVLGNSPQRIDIINCEVKVGTLYPIIGSLHDTPGIYNIQNLTIEADEFNTNEYCQVILANFTTLSADSSINVKGVRLNLKNYDGKFNIPFFYSWYDLKGTMAIESTFVDVKSSVKSTAKAHVCNKMFSGDVIVKSFLYTEKHNGGERKYYMGDLSGMTYNHKTGKYQSYTQDALGIFYTRLTDSALTKMGYSKVEKYSVS